MSWMGDYQGGLAAYRRFKNGRESYHVDNATTFE
ncbi:MAG: hypothetical protein QOE77_3108 [Blastocatellia bacterium]|jgi:hypothetical protein|nr:hypothetical protein [Blastocatellia bacterium]